MAGPLYRELAIDLAAHFEETSVLYSGHPDTTLFFADKKNAVDKLRLLKSKEYDRRSISTRLWSWLVYSLMSLLQVLKVPKSTMVFVVSNPPILGFFIWFICKIKGLRYIVLVYDIHPDTAIKFGKLKENALISKAWRGMNKIVWQGALGVFTIGEVMAKTLLRQFDPTKTRMGEVGVISPWADTNSIVPLSKSDNSFAKDFNCVDKVTVLYSGNMGISHDIDSILKAAEILKEEKNINFIFIGEGAKWNYAYNFINDKKLKNTTILPFQPEEMLKYTLTVGDISIVALDSGAEGLMIPSKMYYYMAAGSALIGISCGYNELKQTIIDCECGDNVIPRTPEILATKILELSQNKDKLINYKTNAREAAINKFSRHICTRKMAKQIIRLL